jgi:hypothetical protein
VPVPRSLFLYKLAPEPTSVPTVIPGMAEAILLNHLVNQIQVNVDLLVSQNYISAADGAAIMAKLPAANAAPAVVTVRNNVPAAPVRSPSISVSSNVSQCKALWSYNEDGSVSYHEQRSAIYLIINESSQRNPTICRSKLVSRTQHSLSRYES